MRDNFCYQPISLSISKQAPTPDCDRNGDFIVTRGTFREASYIALDGSSGTVPQWLFLEEFQPVPEKKKRRAESPSTTKAVFIAPEQRNAGHFAAN